MNSWCCGQKIITLIRSHVRVDQYHQEGCSKNITSLQSLTSGNYTSLSELNQRLSMTWPSKNSIHMYFSPFTPNRDYEVLLIHYEVKRWWKERSLSTRVYCLGFFFSFDVCILPFNMVTYWTTGNGVWKKRLKPMPWSTHSWQLHLQCD